MMDIKSELGRKDNGWRVDGDVVVRLDKGRVLYGMRGGRRVYLQEYYEPHKVYRQVDYPPTWDEYMQMPKMWL